MVLWDLAVQADRKIDARLPEITIKDFKVQTSIMLDVTVYADRNISQKKFDKFFRYKDHDMQMTKMRKRKDNVSGDRFAGNH